MSRGASGLVEGGDLIIRFRYAASLVYFRLRAAVSVVLGFVALGEQPGVAALLGLTLIAASVLTVLGRSAAD